MNSGTVMPAFSASMASWRCMAAICSGEGICPGCGGPCMVGDV